MQTRLNERMIEQIIVFATGHKREPSHIREHCPIPILSIEPQQGAFPADGVAEENSRKVDHIVANVPPSGKGHLLSELVQDTVLAKKAADQHDFPKPARGRGVGFRSCLDFYRSVGGTGHAYLLVEKRRVLSL